MTRISRGNWIFAASSALLALAAPFAEWDAIERVRERGGSFVSLDLDAQGVRIRGVSRDVGPAHIAAREVLVHPGSHGLVVHVRDLEASRRPVAPPDPRRPAPNNQETGPPAPPRIDTRGVAVEIVTTGVVRWDLGAAQLEVHDPAVSIDATGRLTASGRASATLHAHGESVRFESNIGYAAPLESWRSWAIDGDAAVDDGPRLPVTGRLGPDGGAVTLQDPAGRSLTVVGDRRARTLDLHGDGFALSNFGGLAERITRPYGIGADTATIGGDVEVDFVDGVRVSLTDAWVSGLRVRNAALSRALVAPETIGVSGDLHRAATGDLHGTLWLSHRELAGHIEVASTADRLSLRAELPTTPCQTLVDGLPEGFADVVRGARVQGELEASVELDLSKRALAELRTIEPAPIRIDEPPGELRIHWPFLESCEVVGDPPSVDFAALDGPYRHRFVGADGRGRARVMASGAEGYAPLHSVRMIAAAFIALEDSRFHKHDGFDREQMEVALWHNIVVGRVSRGASTISQQAARNLWLGVDRSIGRKVAEAFLTSRLEANIDKERILELYLNLIELGPGVHGVADAAVFHFDKLASRLTAAQAVHLAMLAPAPAVYSRRFKGGTVDPQWRAEIRRHLRRMRGLGYISAEQLNAGLRSPLGLVDRTHGR